MTEHEANEALKPKCPDLRTAIPLLTPSEKEQAAKALNAWWPDAWAAGTFSDHKKFVALDVSELQKDLEKVGLAIQPIEKKPLLKDLPTCE